MSLLLARQLFRPGLQPVTQIKCFTTWPKGAKKAFKSLAVAQDVVPSDSAIAPKVTPAAPKVFTEQELPSGRKIKKLSGDDAPRRTVNDLPMELAQQLILKYYGSKSIVKIGRRKVTKHLAGQIQARWNNTEVVKLHADHKVAKSNMKELAYEVERQTGGIVIWMSGAKLLVYRDLEYNEVRKAYQAAQHATDRMKALQQKAEERRLQKVQAAQSAT